MFCGMPLGGGVSALLTQAFAGLDWRLLFYVGGMVPILLTVLLYRWMPGRLCSTKDAANERARARGKRCSAAGCAPATLLLWIVFLPTLLILSSHLNWLPSVVAAKGVGRAAAPLASLSFNFASVAGALAHRLPRGSV